eukprot:365535-Chlamydomonas_euryale.AAC.25
MERAWVPHASCSTGGQLPLVALAVLHVLLLATVVVKVLLLPLMSFSLIVFMLVMPMLMLMLPMLAPLLSSAASARHTAALTVACRSTGSRGSTATNSRSGELRPPAAAMHSLTAIWPYHGSCAQVASGNAGLGLGSPSACTVMADSRGTRMSVSPGKTGNVA